MYSGDVYRDLLFATGTVASAQDDVYDHIEKICDVQILDFLAFFFFLFRFALALLGGNGKITLKRGFEVFRFEVQKF